MTFSYTRTLPNGQHQPTSITVPFLTMVPIPTLRIEETYIEFNAKINTTRTRDVSVLKSMQQTTQNLESAGMRLPSPLHFLSSMCVLSHVTFIVGDTTEEEKPYQRMTTFVGNITNQSTDKIGNRVQREFSLLVCRFLSYVCTCMLGPSSCTQSMLCNYECPLRQACFVFLAHAESPLSHHAYSSCPPPCRSRSRLSKTSCLQGWNASCHCLRGPLLKAQQIPHSYLSTQPCLLGPQFR